MPVKPYPYRVVNRTRIGRFEVEQAELVTPDGPAPYSVVHMRPFACCAAFVDGKLAFVRQYRYAVGAYQLELPAGGIEPGERPQEAAVRELREETGLVCERVHDLGTLYTSAGSTDEHCYLYAMRCARERVASAPDAGEQIEVMLLDRSEVERLMDEGSLCHPSFYVAWVRLMRAGLLDELFSC